MLVLLEAVKFHPSGRMLMAAGGDKKLRFFQIDGDKNEKIMSKCANFITYTIMLLCSAKCSRQLDNY